MTTALVSEFVFDSPIVRFKLHPEQNLLWTITRETSLNLLQIWQFDSDYRLTKLAEFPQSKTRDSLDVHQPDVGDPGRIEDAAFHPNLPQIAIARGNRPVVLYNYINQSSIELGHCPCARDSVCFSNRGRYIIYSSFSKKIDGLNFPLEGNSTIYDLHRRRVAGRFWPSNIFAVHPTERLLALGWDDQGGGTVRFLSLRPPFHGYNIQIDPDCAISNLKFSPDGHSLAVFDSKWVWSLRLYALRRLQSSFFIERPLPDAPPAGGPSSDSDAQRVVFSRDSSMLIIPNVVETKSGEVLFIDARTGAITGHLSAHRTPITNIDILYRFGVFATSDSAGMIRFWQFLSPPAGASQSEPSRLLSQWRHRRISPLERREGEFDIV